MAIRILSFVRWGCLSGIQNNGEQTWTWKDIHMWSAMCRPCDHGCHVSAWWFQPCKVIFRAHRDIHKNHQAVPKLFHSSNLINQASYMFIASLDLGDAPVHYFMDQQWTVGSTLRAMILSCYKLMKVPEKSMIFLPSSVVCSQVGLWDWDSSDSRQMLQGVLKEPWSA